MPVAGAVAGIGSALIGASASKKAANAQSRAADQQAAVQREIYQDTKKRFEPYEQAGGQGLAAYMHEMGLGEAPEGYGGFTATPGYDFRVQQGQDSVNALAGARGGLMSGRTLSDLTRFGQGIAADEYGSYMGRLAGLTDMGQASAGNQAQAGNAYAAGMSNALAQKGNAQAAGYAGMANAIQGGIGNMMGIYQYQAARDPLGNALSGAGLSGVRNVGGFGW